MGIIWFLEVSPYMIPRIRNFSQDEHWKLLVNHNSTKFDQELLWLLLFINTVEYNCRIICLTYKKNSLPPAVEDCGAKPPYTIFKIEAMEKVG